MSKLVYAVSSVSDGTMKKTGSDPNAVDANRKRFLTKNGIELEQSILVYLTYDGDDYCRFRTVDKSNTGQGMVTTPDGPADALFTRSVDTALFLPLADCIGAVLHDQENGILGLLHLGRHNLEQYAGTHAIEFMQREFGSVLKNLKVYLSPAAGKQHYPLYLFENKSLHEVALDQLVSAGVIKTNIVVDSRDTTTDPEHFSHSEFLKGNRDSNGRHALVAMLH